MTLAAYLSLQYLTSLGLKCLGLMRLCTPLTRSWDSSP